MAKHKDMLVHHSQPDLFREALGYTEAKTGFQSSMIEKDYYCSLILDRLFQEETNLVFKGGTCLSKVYTDFYRMSEDLDFVVPVPVRCSRTERRSKVKSVKAIFMTLPDRIPGVRVAQDLIGHNESKQYVGVLAYLSVVIDRRETVKVEIGLREPLLLDAKWSLAKTIIQNPFSDGNLVPDACQVNAMALTEAYAEKVRAALTRREPAIRDFYDLSLSVIKGLDVNLQDNEFIEIVKQKLGVAGNDPVNMSSARRAALGRQLETELKPVLRATDYTSFDLADTFERIEKLARVLD
jgi:predicted nucleotidyltransferase component of viral defense system